MTTLLAIIGLSCQIVALRQQVRREDQTLWLLLALIAWTGAYALRTYGL